MNRPTTPPPPPGRSGALRRAWAGFRGLPGWLQIVTVVVTLAAVGALGGDDDADDPVEVASAAADTAQEATPEPEPTEPEPAPAPAPDPVETTEAPAAAASDEPESTPEPAPTAAPTEAPANEGSSWRVVNVVDGDTLDVRSSDGVEERVRMVGIDTPERGQCGYGEASLALADLVMGREVDLVAAAQDDRDRYDRILRYVDVDGTDAGLTLIEQGLARARYDSRDGYGAHPREDAYVAADAAMPDITCDFDDDVPAREPSATPEAPAPTTGGGDTTVYPNCDALNRVYPGGVARSDVTGNTVKGELRPFGRTPHVDDALYALNRARDGDKDGIACEQ